MLTIIIATYNSEKTIVKCLESLKTQSLQNFEILIKDGGSTDSTVKLIRGCDLKVSYIESSQDKGVYDAWNHCIPKVNGEWFTFLGSDDYLSEPDFLAKLRIELDAALLSNKMIAYGKNRIVNGAGVILEEIGDPWNVAELGIRSRMTIRHPGCFYHRDLLTKVGGFDPSYMIAGDHHFTLKCLEHTKPYFYDFVGVCHQLGGMSTNPERAFDLIRETYKIRRSLRLKPYLNLDMLFFKRATLAILAKLVGASATSRLMHFNRHLKTWRHKSIKS